MRVLITFWLGLLLAVTPAYAQSQNADMQNFAAWAAETANVRQGAMELVVLSGEADEISLRKLENEISTELAMSQLATWREQADAELARLTAAYAGLQSGPQMTRSDFDEVINGAIESTNLVLEEAARMIEDSEAATRAVISGESTSTLVVAAARLGLIQSVYAGVIQQNNGVLRTRSEGDSQGTWVLAMNENIASTIVLMEVVRRQLGAEPSVFHVDDPLANARRRAARVRTLASQGHREVREQIRMVRRLTPGTEQERRMLPLIIQIYESVDEGLELEQRMARVLVTSHEDTATISETGDLAALSQLEALENERVELQMRQIELSRQMFAD
ncbi:hypothetical protein [Maricaulis sp.]|uniref:hypothetical protein n=1 Tax=Maricaulis sp. TaxID=1486257 RepID=UPI003A8CE744